MIEIRKITTLGEESIAVMEYASPFSCEAAKVSYYPLGTTLIVDIDGPSKRIDPVLPAFSDS
jgi:hypothetical protein